MKLQQLTLWCKSLSLSIPVLFTVTGLLLVGIMITAATGTSYGLFSVEASAVSVSSQALQDELHIQLSENGFTPSEAQRAAGTFGIAVENSALTSEYTLKLKAEDGTVVKEVQVQKGSAAWTVTLAAGEYRLTEASHPQWLCRITLQ